ncbi:Metal tolerance protein C2 [Ranunculus cassubicifolius]
MSFIYQNTDPENSPNPYNINDRRLAFHRQNSLHNQSTDPHTPISIISNPNDPMIRPLLTRSNSTINIPPPPSIYSHDSKSDGGIRVREEKLVESVLKSIWGGNRQMKRLFVMITLNVAYSSAELLIGILSGRVELVSDAFHLTFGCGLLTFSLFAMAASKRKEDGVYTYGYQRLEVLSAFTNALFLLFMSFSLAVEALHAFIQDESEHKHYLIVSAVTNLLVNLLGIWFFRNYARVNLAYRKAEDMNFHSICLHVIADSIRSAGIVLASWLLTLGVKNAEVLCLGMVSVAVFLLVIPLFKTTGGILLQMAPSIPSSALNKCFRQITCLEDVSEITQARFWELIPGHTVGSLQIQVKDGADHNPILHFVHNLYHELGIQDLTVQIDNQLM